MKTYNLLFITVITLLLIASGCSTNKQAIQTGSQALSRDTISNPTSLTLDLTKINPACISDYDSFKEAVRPLIDEMGTKKIVSLGEATHGTSEFYKIRYWLTKILVEEKGFNHIAFENDYSDSYLLNEALQENTVDYRKLMKDYLIAIWQNRETEELLQWIRTYNQANERKIHFQGIDQMFASNDARMLQKLVKDLNNRDLHLLTKELMAYAVNQDSDWVNSNKKDFQLVRDKWFYNGLNGYKTVEKIEHILGKMALPDHLKEQMEGFTVNAKLAFDTFYQYDKNQGGSSRDSAMAEMAGYIVRKKEDKLIIWAHNGHVAKGKLSFGGSPFEVAGGFIEKKFPGNYFVLGTGTASGSFAATPDQFINCKSKMSPSLLESPLTGSWEKAFTETDASSFYLTGRNLKEFDQILLHRFVGYGSNSGKDTFVPVKLAELYDAFFFIGETTAAKWIE